MAALSEACGVALHPDRFRPNLIVGGGLNGPALALALAQGGHRVTLIDALPRPVRTGDEFDGRAYALALASVRMLRALGLWDRLGADAQPMLGIVVSDGRAGEGAGPWTLRFDHAEIEEGPMGHLVEDRHLRAVLLDAMDADDRITHLADETVTAQAVVPGGVAATLASGATISARLLIGADGRGSGTAARAGIGRQGWGYGQTAVVCAVAHERPHDGVAHQFFMPGGPLAILPLTGDRSATIRAALCPIRRGSRRSGRCCGGASIMSAAAGWRRTRSRRWMWRCGT